MRMDADVKVDVNVSLPVWVRGLFLMQIPKGDRAVPIESDADLLRDGLRAFHVARREVYEANARCGQIFHHVRNVRANRNGRRSHAQKHLQSTDRG
jgi:hypothetical protein